MYHRILVPLDGSKLAEAALPFAEMIPSRSVRLLQVEPIRVAAVRQRAGAADGTGPSWRLQRTIDAVTYLQGCGAELRRQGRDVDFLVELGDPAERIVTAAGDADLIVMATRGLSGLDRTLCGSVADEVMRASPVPTLLVRGHGHGPIEPLLRRVVVPLDGSGASETALPVAAMVGRTLGLPLHLVQAVGETDTGLPLTEADLDADAYLTRHARRLAGRDVVASTEIVVADPVPALLGLVGRGDLVVMATRGRGGVRRWLVGSVAEQVVRLAKAPVLLVRAEKGSDPSATEAPNEGPPVALKRRATTGDSSRDLAS